MFLGRLIEEEKELHIKIVKLDNFIFTQKKVFDTLDVEHKHLLLEQLRYMNEYDRTLIQRITLVKGENNGKD